VVLYLPVRRNSLSGETRLDKLELELKKSKEMNNLLLSAIERVDRERLAENLMKKNSDFVQLSNPAIVELVKLSKKHHTAFEILMFLVKKMSKQNAVVVSRKTLSDLTGRTTRTVYNATKYLNDHRWIDVVKVGTANAYLINSQVFFKSSRNKRYATFSAQVITSVGEQESKNLDVMFSSKLKNIPDDVIQKIVSQEDDENQIEIDLSNA